MTHQAKMPLTLTFLGYLFVVASHHLPGRRRRRAAAAAFAADLEAGNGDAAPGPKRGTIVALVLLTATVFCPRAFFFFLSARSRRRRGGGAYRPRAGRGGAVGREPDCPTTRRGGGVAWLALRFGRRRPGPSEGGSRRPA